MVAMNRRQFLRGRVQAEELRPPWLRDPARFTDTCTQCGQCLEHCPEHILRAGDGGFPVVDFKLGECTFCGECTRHCEAGLFTPFRECGAAGWQHKARVSESCLAHLGVMCRSCEDACEPRAIRFPLAAARIPGPVIDPDSCTGCGACVRPCPEFAISMA